VNVYAQDIEFLEHFGVKGMKWGVRRAERRVLKAHAKLDEQNEARMDRLETRAKRTQAVKAVAKVSAAAIAVGGSIYVAKKLKERGVKSKSPLNRKREVEKGKEAVRLAFGAKGIDKRGKPWSIQTNDGHAFAMMVKELANRNK